MMNSYKHSGLRQATVALAACQRIVWKAEKPLFFGIYSFPLKTNGSQAKTSQKQSGVTQLFCEMYTGQLLSGPFILKIHAASKM